MTNALHAGGADLSPGSKLGPYVIDRELGSGGMGCVYRARDSRLDRDVALKVIRSAYSSDAARRRRFETEARAAARVAHPNIVAVYDVGEENATPYIVSELVTGGTLAERMRRGPLAFDYAMSIAIAVAEGLAEAHRNNVIHRDLKPENILLSSTGTPKISDFGLSKMLEPVPSADPDTSTAVAALTAEGAILGTPAYMSPEQAAGRDADYRADQFSFGIVLLEMLTGETPFRRPSSVQTLAAILHDEPDYARLARAIPAPLVAIVKRCLAKEPARRYASTDDLVRDLHDATSAPSRRGARPLVIAAAAVLVVVAIGAGLLLMRPRPANSKIESLAILPLQNLSGDRAQEYFADGLTEELTSQLAGVRALRVASRTSANAFRGTTKPLPQVAKSLGVDALIEGSVVRSGQETRVTIQLIDGRSDRHLWSQSFESRGSNALTLEREIAREIADRVRVSLSPDERARMASLPTTNSEAYDAYLHATYKLRTAFGDADDAAAALQYAEKAVALDPTFANAYVAVARACQANLFTGNGDRQLDEKGFVAVEKALSLNPSLPEAFMARGELQFNRWHGFNVAGAIADYKRAIELNPNLANAHHNLGSDLTHLGLHSEAIDEFRTTLRLEPDNGGAKFRLARAFWQSNRFQEAIDTYERYGVESFEKPVALAYAGRMADAWRAVDMVEPDARGRVGDADRSASRALLYAIDGKSDEAKAQISRSVALGQRAVHFHHAAFIIAAAYAEMASPKEAVHWLDFSANSGMPNYPLFHDNPSMRKLHGNADYEKFMSDLRLRWDQISAQIK